MERANPESNYPESRVLVIGTGGTICMQPTEDGLKPIASSGGFLNSAMAPRPSFNDLSEPRGELPVCGAGCGHIPSEDVSRRCLGDCAHSNHSPETLQGTVTGGCLIDGDSKGAGHVAETQNSH